MMSTMHFHYFSTFVSYFFHSFHPFLSLYSILQSHSLAAMNSFSFLILSHLLSFFSQASWPRQYSYSFLYSLPLTSNPMYLFSPLPILTFFAYSPSLSSSVHPSPM